MKKARPLFLTALLLFGCDVNTDSSIKSSLPDQTGSFLKDGNGQSYRKEWLEKGNAFEEKISEHIYETPGTNNIYFGQTKIKAEAEEVSPSLPVDFVYGTSYDEDYPELRGKEVFLHIAFTLIDQNSQSLTRIESDIASLWNFDYNSFSSFAVSFPEQDIRYVIFNTFGHFQFDFSVFKDKISSAKRSWFKVFSYVLMDDSCLTDNKKRYRVSTTDNDTVYFSFKENGRLSFSASRF